MSAKNPFELEQVAVRLVKEPPLLSSEKIDCPEAAVRLLADALMDYDREVLCVVNLKADLKPINMSIVSVGGLSEAYAHPREILKCAFLSNAHSIILLHTHPSGTLTPSKSDVLLTDRMQNVCAMVGIPIIDHIIIGAPNHYYSFKEKNMMPFTIPSYESDIEKFHLETKEKVAEKTSVKENLKSSQKRVAKKSLVQEKVKVVATNSEKAKAEER
ncbi:MAG: JAB domain-containing protein [Mobilitalea sp.]